MVVSPSSGAGIEMIAAARKWWHKVVVGVACLFLGGPPRRGCTGGAAHVRAHRDGRQRRAAVSGPAFTRRPWRCVYSPPPNGGIPDSLSTYLAEDPAVDPANIQGRSTREGVTQAIDAIAARAKPADNVMILLIGHGSSQNDESRFSMPGPDLTAGEVAKLRGPSNGPDGRLHRCVERQRRVHQTAGGTETHSRHGNQERFRRK